MALTRTKPIICPILIGREADLTALHTLIDQAKRGEGQVALVSGEAGIGKSRLVAEGKTYAIAQNFKLLQGNCFPGDFSCPYAPLLDLLRSQFAGQSSTEVATELNPFAREFAQLVPDLVPPLLDSASTSPLPQLDSEQEKRRLFEALTRWVTGLAKTQPVVLIIEDVHWSDETSLDWLHYLARRSAACPLLLMVTYRNDEVAPSLSQWLTRLDRERLAQEFPLVRLTRNDLEVMLRTIFSFPRSRQLELPDPLYTLTDGNPFFIEEILKSLIVAEEIFYEDGTWDRKPLSELHIPRSLHDAVQQRINQLSGSARQVLRLAAIAGRRFDFALLQRLTQLDEQQLLMLMKELIAAQLVVEESEERFAFRHALTREAIYSELLVRERKALHRTVAETIEQLYTTTIDAHLAELAYQYYESGVWSKALDYAQRAGERAQRMYDSRAAIQQFTLAVNASSYLALEVSAILYHARGQAYETIGEFEQALSDYERALEIAQQTQDGKVEWQSLLDLGFLWAGRDYAQTGDYYLQALALARTIDDPATVAHSLNRLGNWYLNVEQPHKALRCHEEALATFQSLSDRHGKASTLDLLGMASYLSGDLIQSTAYYQQAVTLFRELDEREGLISSLVTLMHGCGNYQTETLIPAATSWAEARQMGELALKTAREIGQRSGEAYALRALGQCLGPRGEYTQALKLAQDGLSIAEEIGHHQWMAAGHWVLGALYLDLLVLPTAQQHMEQAVALARESGSLFWIRTTTGFLAMAHMLQFDLAQAESLLTTAFDPDTPSQTVGQRIIWYARAKLALARGSPNLTLQITDRLSTSAANVSAQRCIPCLSKLRGEALAALHQEAEAETILRMAQEITAAQGARPLLWRICVSLGNLYQTQSRQKEAERAFSSARTIIEELSANIPDEQVQEHFLRESSALLPRTRAIFSPRRAAKQAVGGLTPREREVAVFIAQGKSNRDIADELVVSYRTVETHVGAILSKLAFSSRAQIAVWAVEIGLVKQAE